MTKQIWKYPVDLANWFEREIPAGAQILSVHVQAGEPQMWAMVDLSNKPEKREFGLYGTGHTMPDDPGKFIGTFQLADGDLVFHLFECT